MAEYRCLVDKHNGPEPYFEFVGEFKKKTISRSNPTRVIDDQSTPTHDRASAQGMLNRVYPNAVEVASPASIVKWLPWVSLVILTTLSVFIGFFVIKLSIFIFSHSVYILIFALIALLASFIFNVLGFFFLLKIDIFTPKHRPMLFNRKTRDVWIFKIGLPNFFRFWEKPTTEVVKRPWDGIHVRTYRQTVASASMVTARRQLYLLWGKPDEPHVLDELAPLGNQTNWQDEVLFPLWEHVRRYMEEGGPAVPPGEQLGEYSQYPSPFPPEAIEAAGGAPYREAEVRRMAGLD